MRMSLQRLKKMEPHNHNQHYHSNCVGRKRILLLAPMSACTSSMMCIAIIFSLSLPSIITTTMGSSLDKPLHMATTSDIRRISKRQTEKDFAPKLIHQPQSVLVQPNKPHTIECPVEAKPEAEVKWFKDRQLLVSQPAHLEQTGSELMFFQMNEDDTGDYYCQATNYLGSAESEHFKLTVQSSVHDPRIGLEPRLAEVGADQQVEFTCSIPSAGTTATTTRQKRQQQQRAGQANTQVQKQPEVAWRRNGKRLTVDWLDEGEELQEARARFVVRQASASKFVLTITRVHLKDDNATFTCLFTPESAQEGASSDGLKQQPAAYFDQLESSQDGDSTSQRLAHESSPAKLRVYAQQQQQQPNVAAPDGHVKLDVNLAPPIDNLASSNRPQEIHGQQQPAANHTTQLGHEHPSTLADNNSSSRRPSRLRQTLEDLYEIAKPALIVFGVLLLVSITVLLQLLYIRRRTRHQNRYMQHQYNGCGVGGPGSSSSSSGSGASSAIGAGSIDCHDPVLNSLMARTLSAPGAASLGGAALNGKKYRSYRDHMRKVAAAASDVGGVGNDMVDCSSYFAAAVAAAAAAAAQQHPSSTVVDPTAANSFFAAAAAANSAAALPNLYNQSLAAREQARNLLQASEHMRSLSNLSHGAAQQQLKHQQQGGHLRLSAGQNGSHLNLPLSFAFGNPATTTNNSRNGDQATTQQQQPGATRLIDGAAQLMTSALWPPHLSQFRGQQQQAGGLLSQPARLQSDEHYQLVNCSSISPSSSSSMVGSNSSSNPRDSHLRPHQQGQNNRDSSSLNHYSTIENNEDDEDRYEEVDYQIDSAINNRRLQQQQRMNSNQRQDSFRIARTSTFGANSDQQQQGQHRQQDNQKPSSLRSSFISSSNSSSSGCGESTKTTSSLASAGDAFSRFGLKGSGHQRSQTPTLGRQQTIQDQLSPYAVSSICGSVPQPQIPPPPPMTSEAMRALNEQFDINQLMLLDAPSAVSDNNQDGLIGFNAPPLLADNSTVDSNQTGANENNLSQQEKRKLKQQGQQ